MKDCRRDTFRVSGSGGQHRDKTSSGIRITHLASGAVGQSSENRSQLANTETAFRRMAESFKYQCWVKENFLAQGSSPEAARSDERIRTYNLIDRRVTDHRTKHQSANVDGILDGDIDSLYRRI